MLKKVKQGEVVFCELVEHPGGHDGGQFPQDEEFTLYDGELFYNTGYPVTVNSDFECYGEEDANDKDNYVHCPRKEDALARLTAELRTAETAVAELKLLVAAAADENVGYVVLWEGNNGSEDE